MLRTFPVEYWKLDQAVDRLAGLQATGVCYYSNETDHSPFAYTVVRQGRAWVTDMTRRLTVEQIADLEKKAACQLTYATKDTVGTLHLLFIPTKQTKDELTTRVQKEIINGLRNKRQR